MLPNSGEAPQYQQGTKALLPRVTDNIHSRAISEQIFIQICSLYAATVLGSKSWSAMGTSLGGVQWLRIHLPMQMMQVQSLVEDVAGQLNWHMQQKNPMCCNQDPMQPKKKKRSVSHEESKHGPALREPVSGGPTRHSLPSYSPIIFPSCPPMSGQGKKILVGQPTSPTFFSPAAPLPLPSKGLHSSYSPSQKVTPPAPCAR